MDYAKTIVNELGQALSSISERNTENLIDMIEYFLLAADVAA